jgi:hypothetical protein
VPGNTAPIAKKLRSKEIRDEEPRTAVWAYRERLRKLIAT